MNSSAITFTRLAELYVLELRSGGAPKIDEYVQAFPHLADVIQYHFPTLQVLESVRSPVELQPGQQIGDYVIDKEIGRGGMGIVYSAQDVPNSCKVALKVLPLRGLGSDGGRRFSHEREAMARLSHPNIVPVYSYGCTKDFAYLVMKYIEGHNLSQVLKGEADQQALMVMSQLRTNWVAFAEMAATLAAGLQHAHDHDMVHRDIKPANLLLDVNNKIWITDFGLAKLWDAAHSLSLTGEVIGTLLYMAPEQSQGICDARSDIFSLGVTLYELASGQRASQGATIGARVRNRSIGIRDIRDVCPAVPAELAKIIMRACQYDPSNRYQTAAEMHYVLSRYCEGQEKADRRDSRRPSNEVFHQRKRNRVRLTVAAAGCAGLLLIASPSIIRSLRYALGVASGADTRAEDDFEGHVSQVIDAVTQGGHEELVESVSGLIEATIEKHSASHWNYSDSAKRDLLHEAKKIKQMFKDRKLTVDHVGKFFERFRESPLAVSGRLAWLRPLCERTFTDPSEQEWAFELLRQFSTVIDNGHIEVPAAKSIIDSLTRDRIASLGDADQTQISVAELRAWLKRVEAMLAALPSDQTRKHVKLPQELEEIFAEAFGEIEAKEP